MMMYVWGVLLLYGGLVWGSKYNNLAQTPPMGWLSWTRFECNVDCYSDPDNCIGEKLIKDMADRMVADGYKDAGYEYVCLDDCWLSTSRNSTTMKLQTDSKRFPSGIKGVADYVHSKGLKLGIYEDFGTKTCAGFPGSEFFMELDAQTFADWGVDLLKFDVCNSDAHNCKYGFPAMAKYLNQTGRQILFSCEWPYGELQAKINISDFGDIRDTCNIWRVFWDVADTWDSIKGYIDYWGKNNMEFMKYTGPGGWFDPDMLMIGNFGLSYYQQKIQMAMWSMWSAPMLMSNDLRIMRPESKAVLLNKKVIAVNQDPLGVMATKLLEVGGLQLWIKPIVPKGSMAVAYLNTNNNGNGILITIKLSDITLGNPGGYNVTELFEGQFSGVFKPEDPISFRVYPNDVFMFTAITLS